MTLAKENRTRSYDCAIFRPFSFESFARQPFRNASVQPRFKPKPKTTLKLDERKKNWKNFLSIIFDLAQFIARMAEIVMMEEEEDDHETTLQLRSVIIADTIIFLGPPSVKKRPER